MNTRLNIKKTIIMSLSVLGIFLGSPLMVGTASAQIQSGLDATKKSTLTQKTPDTLVKDVINIMLYVIGIIAVIMLIFGGIRYATSAGDSNKVTSAKNTIIYAIVGLIVAIFAYAIVNWVVGKLI